MSQLKIKRTWKGLRHFILNMNAVTRLADKKFEERMFRNIPEICIEDMAMSAAPPGKKSFINIISLKTLRLKSMFYQGQIDAKYLDEIVDLINYLRFEGAMIWDKPLSTHHIRNEKS